MNNNQAMKRNISSMQVLKTLQVLLDGNYTMTDLIKKLNENEKKPLFNHSVVSKYINTCRYLGIDIPKIHNKYFVANLPFGLDLSGRDLELLEKLQIVSAETFSIKNAKSFENFISNLSKYSNKNIAKVDHKTTKMCFELFDKAIAEKRKIRFMYKAKSSIECIPLGIVETTDRTYYNVLKKNNKEKLIATDRVAGIEILDQRFIQNFAGQVAIFRLTGDLAKRYTPRDHEQVTINDDGSIVVSNKGENKELLFSRLLRYDTCCELLHPRHYREEMKQLLEDMLENYGE